MLWNKLHIPSEWYVNVHSLILKLLMLKYLFLVKRKLDRVYNGLLIKLVFNSIVLTYLPLALEYIAYDLYLLNKLKPCVSVIRNEYNMWERSLVLSSKKTEVFTVAIQHGIIHELHRGYIYDSDETPLFVDKLVLYGNKFRDMICKYNDKLGAKIVVEGCPRYDGTLLLSRNVDLNTLKRIVLYKYGLKDILGKNYIFILWTTQTHALSELIAKQYINDVCLAVNGVNGKCTGKVLLLIKPHPGEIGTESLYVSIINSLNCNAKLLPKISNIYELMIISDILLTLNSTTALEFRVLGKNKVVLYNPINDKLASYYAREGIGVEARNVKELEKILYQFTKKNTDSLSKRKSIVDYYFKRVGYEATSRIAGLIIQLCKV